MLSVTNINGQTEPLNNYQRPEIIEEVNGAFTLAVTSFFVENNPGHALLEEESIVSVDGYDFRVKQMKEQRNRKEIVAISTFYDLIGTWKEEIYGGTRTFDEFVSFIFSGTGWTVSNVDMEGYQFIPNFGANNVIKLAQDLCAVYKCEYKTLPNKIIQFAKQIGPDNDAQYRYGHNVQALSKSVDTTNLRTTIKGYGGNGLAVTYTSPYAVKYGEIEAEPFEDEDYFTADEMIGRLKSELTDYPEVSIELDSVELTDKETGERVWLIYEPMGIEFQTRIMAKKSIIRDGIFVTESVTIGNAIPRSLSDILTDTKIEIDENNKRTKSRIEQTNEQITLAVERFAGEMLEAYSKIEITADEIRSEVAAFNEQLEDGIAQNKSLISQTATEIRAEVTSDIERMDGTIEILSSSISQTASSIRSEVNESVTRLDGRINTANSSITQLSNSITSIVSTSIQGLEGRVSSAESSISQQETAISSKVSQTDFNGTTLVSMINQTPSYIEIDSKNINLVGAVSVLSDISGNLGTITAGNINLQNAIHVGDGVHLRGSRRTGVYFDTLSQIFDDGGSMQIESYYGLTIVASSLDFSYVRGTINWGKHKPVAVWG